MSVVAGYWAEDHHFQDWDRAIRQIYDSREAGGTTVWLGLRNYPAHLLTYALGFGATASGKLNFLGQLFNATINRQFGDRDQLSIVAASHTDVAPLDWNRLLPGKEQHHTPRSDRIHDVLKEPCSQLLISDEDYSHTFDKFEILMALSVYLHRAPSLFRFPIGCFLYRYQNRQRVLREIRQSLEAEGARSQFAVCDIFGTDATECLHLIDKFETFVMDVAQRRMIWTPVY